MTEHSATLDAVARPLPHSVQMEKSVLSSMMKDPGLLQEFPLDPEIFYLPAHRLIYRTCRDIGDGDLTLVVSKLHDRGELDSAGGPATVTDVYTYAPGRQFFEKHLGILRDRQARRMAIRACNEAIAACHDCADDEAGYLSALAGPITAVFDTVAAAKPPEDLKALVREFLADFENKVHGRSLPMGIPTGIPEVDNALRGIHPQMMGIISARSGGGKSTMATQMAANIASDGVGVLYLILERTTKSAFARAVIQQAGVHHQAVTDPLEHARANGKQQLDKITLSSIRRGLNTVADSENLHFRKPDNRKLATVCAEIRRYVRLHGVSVVFLDQIGLVKGLRQKGDSDEVERRGVSNTLQELAHELNITIIVLSQVTDDGDTKGARAVEEDADWWLSIIQERDRKKENFGEHLHVLIAKDSHNGKGGERLPLVLDRQNLRFVYGFPKKQEEEKPRGRDRWSGQRR